MADVRDLTVRINGDASDYTKTVNDVAKTNDKAKSSFAELTKAFVFGNVLYSVGANAVVKFKDSLTDIIQQANEAARTQAQLNAVIQSTGGVAGVTAKSANELADSIRDNTAIDNDAVLAAENMLLTFRDIGKNTFPTATKAVVDMATAMNGGAVPNAEKLRDTVIQVGKALQDPVKGVTTLRRVGVQLSDQQQKQVQDFINVNDKAAAQKVILDELSKEFGGSAAATAETFSGKMQQLKNRMDDFGKSVVLNIEGYLNKNLPTFETFANKVGDVADKVWNFLKPSLDALWNTITTQLIPALLNFWHNVIEPILPVIGTALVLAIWAVTNGLNVLLQAVTPVMNFLADHTVVVEVLAGAFVALKTAMFLNDAFAAIQAGVAILTGTTFPAMIASIEGVTATWVAAFPVAGILVDIALVADAISKVIYQFTTLKSLQAQQKTEQQENQQTISQLEARATLSNDPKIRAQSRQALHNLKIPGYATGGIVPATPGGQIVRVAEGGQDEAIIPLSKNGSPSLGGGVHLHVNVGMYAGMPVEKRQIALALYKELVRAARSQGVSLPMIGAVGVQ